MLALQKLTLLHSLTKSGKSGPTKKKQQQKTTHELVLETWKVLGSYLVLFIMCTSMVCLHMLVPQVAAGRFSSVLCRVGVDCIT